MRSFFRGWVLIAVVSSVSCGQRSESMVGGTNSEGVRATGSLYAWQGSAIVGAEIWAFGWEDINNRQECVKVPTTTMARGAFLFEGLNPCFTWILSIEREGFADLNVRFPAVVDGAYDLGELVLTHPGSISGVTSFGDGEVAPGLRCDLYLIRTLFEKHSRPLEMQWIGMKSNRSDSLGRFRFDALPAGEFALVITREGRDREEVKLKLDHGQEIKEIALVIER